MSERQDHVGMDAQTLACYANYALQHAAHQRSMCPDDLYRLALTYFHAGAPTADIGCGSGRDTAWLAAQGFAAVGYDAVPALLAEARHAFPAISFQEAALPDLAALPDGSYANVFCSAVLMHLPAPHLITAALALARILRPDGRLLLSYRASRAATDREADGRLFTAIPPGKLTLLLEACGLRVRHTTTAPDPQRPQIRWHTLVAEQSPLPVARGLERVQAVLAQDRKVATYKLALIRSLCRISRTAAEVVRWEDGQVLIPLWAVAIHWLRFYWPLLTDTAFIAQIRGETPVARKPLAFRQTVVALAAEFGAAGLYDLLQQLDTAPARFVPALTVIAAAIRDGPVRHAGTAARLFTWRAVPRQVARIEDRFGWVVVPEAIWLDIARFDHWIEDSVVLRWARLTAEMNPAEALGAGRYLPLLLQEAGDAHDTAEVRRLVLARAQPLTCVWSGVPLRTDFAVDHLLPYAVWGNNDLWNLLPSQPRLNAAKRDALPTRRLLERRQDAIVDYWAVYRQAYPARFARQIGRALGGDVTQAGWEVSALACLQGIVERLATTRGLARWEP